MSFAFAWIPSPAITFNVTAPVEPPPVIPVPATTEVTFASTPALPCGP